MQGDKHVILYVEDDQDYRNLMRAALESHGYVYVEASSGAEGIQKFKAHKPDLVILDLMMEEIDTGTAMVGDLRSAGCEAPIFVLSSVGNVLQRSTDYTQLGLDGVLQKPVDFDNLIRLIESKLA